MGVGVGVDVGVEVDVDVDVDEGVCGVRMVLVTARASPSGASWMYRDHLHTQTYILNYF